jgi:hypothetical protein
MTQNHWRNGENLTQKETDTAEHLRVAPHTANSMVLKKNDVASPVKKRREGREPTFHEPDSVLLAWYQDACISSIPVDGQHCTLKS